MQVCKGDKEWLDKRWHIAVVKKVTRANCNGKQGVRLLSWPATRQNPLWGHSEESFISFTSSKMMNKEIAKSVIGSLNSSSIKVEQEGERMKDGTGLNNPERHYFIKRPQQDFLNYPSKWGYAYIEHLLIRSIRCVLWSISISKWQLMWDLH